MLLSRLPPIRIHVRLPDGRTKPHWVCHGDTIDIFAVQKMTIFVRFGGVLIELEDLQPSDTIAEVKACIDLQENIRVERQHLFHREKELEDVRTLADYNVRDFDWFTLRPRKITIYVMIADLRILLEDVQPSDTIEDVKRFIEAQEGIPAEQQRLLHSYNELDDARTLAHYNVKESDTLTLLTGVVRLYRLS